MLAGTVLALLSLLLFDGCGSTKKVIDTNQKNNIVQENDSVSVKDSVSFESSTEKTETESSDNIVETNILVVFDDSTRSDLPLSDIKNAVLSGKNIKSIQITQKETKHSETQKNEVENVSVDMVCDSAKVSSETIDKSETQTKQKENKKSGYSNSKFVIVIFILVCVLLYLLGCSLE